MKAIRQKVNKHAVYSLAGTGNRPTTCRRGRDHPGRRMEPRHVGDSGRSKSRGDSQESEVTGGQRENEVT